MAALFVVNYPRNANSTFNESYYIKEHMPLVEKQFTQHVRGLSRAG